MVTVINNIHLLDNRQKCSKTPIATDRHGMANSRRSNGTVTLAIFAVQKPVRFGSLGE